MSCNPLLINRNYIAFYVGMDLVKYGMDFNSSCIRGYIIEEASQMKVVMIFFLVLFLSGSTWITGTYNLFASEDNEVEKEMIEDEEVKLEDSEDNNEVDTDEYLRIMNEESLEEGEPEEESDDPGNEEKEFPEDKYIDDRG